MHTQPVSSFDEYVGHALHLPDAHTRAFNLVRHRDSGSPLFAIYAPAYAIFSKTSFSCARLCTYGSRRKSCCFSRTSVIVTAILSSAWPNFPMTFTHPWS